MVTNNEDMHLQQESKDYLHAVKKIYGWSAFHAELCVCFITLTACFMTYDVS